MGVHCEYTGDIGDGMYFIESGTVIIRVEYEDKEQDVSEVSNGKYFGELALITHKQRAASVYAKTDCSLACKFSFYV